MNKSSVNIIGELMGDVHRILRKNKLRSEIWAIYGRSYKWRNQISEKYNSPIKLTEDVSIR
jgi:hypothetical protein